MVMQFPGISFAAVRRSPLAIFGLVLLLNCHASHAQESEIPPCNEDAMIVFDASGSMSGNQTLGIPNSKARIDEVRSALAKVLPSAAKFRRVGLITYGPGPYNECNVKLNLAPSPNAAARIMSEVNALVPAGKTPLTSAVEQAADVLQFRDRPGVVVVVTDGEETCGRSPCTLAKELHAVAAQLTVHVIGFRYQNFSWTGGQSLLDAKCLAEKNNGLYITAQTEDELVAALEKTLNCPMVTQTRMPLSLWRGGRRQ